MPLTVPTHPVVVVPLKLWRPRWFDGVALVVGAMAPDFAYATYGFGVSLRTHDLAALVWWSLPVTVVLSRLVRWAAPAVAVHCRLGDLAVLGVVRHRWFVTAGSALIGAFSHLAWDSVTHPNYFSILNRPVWAGTPWWGMLSDVSNLVGFVVGAYVVVRVGRSGVLRDWHGEPPRPAARPVVFWSVVAGVLLVGLGAILVRPLDWFAGQAIRSLLIAGVALLAGAVAVRRGLFSG